MKERNGYEEKKPQTTHSYTKRKNARMKEEKFKFHF